MKIGKPKRKRESDGMELTKDNLTEWKAAVDKLMKKKTGMTLSETMCDKEWLDDCLGDTPEEVVETELSYWSQY
jgi:hypothetical protein